MAEGIVAIAALSRNINTSKENILKYFSIDIETTGLDPEKDQILQIGMVFEDTQKILPLDKLPSLELTIKHSRIEGDPYAIAMNTNIIKQSMSDKSQCEEDTSYDMLTFIIKCLGCKSTVKPTITVAGKNFNTFDLNFLKRMPMFERYVKIHRRTIDPSILCVDWSKDTLPNLTKCLATIGVGDIIKHTAKSDALDVIRVLRAVTNNYSASRSSPYTP